MTGMKEAFTPRGVGVDVFACLHLCALGDLTSDFLLVHPLRGCSQSQKSLQWLLQDCVLHCLVYFLTQDLLWPSQVES